MRNFISASQNVKTHINTQEDHQDELIIQAQKDPALFQEIYRYWVTPVYQFIYARVGNYQDAEDLTSQIFLNAFQAFPHYKHRGHFSAWLFTIARNQLYSSFRKKKTPQVPLEAAEAPSSNPEMITNIIQSAQIGSLKKLIRNLPEEEQELIYLRYVAELKFSDIALVLGRKEPAVKKSLYRLQERLKELMEDYHE